MSCEPRWRRQAQAIRREVQGKRLQSEEIGWQFSLRQPDESGLITPRTDYGRLARVAQATDIGNRLVD